MKVLPISWVCFGLLASISVGSVREVYGNPDVPLVAEVLVTKIHAGGPEEMTDVILGKLLDRHAAEHDIEVKEEI